jgi:DNA-binding HxlR family transcriptional regulator
MVVWEANAVSLILYLADNEGGGEPVSATDLLNVVKSYNRVKAMAETLKDLGLVNVDILKDRNVTFSYSLTPKGRELAKILRKATELISAP